MQPGIPPIPLSKGAATAFVIFALLAGGYPLYLEISNRKDAERAVTGRWIEACAADHDRRTCESSVDDLEEHCLRQARDVVGDRIVFDALPFFECMNARNERGIVVEPPASDDR